MKQECPTYLKTIGKSKALAVTLSDTEPANDSDNDDAGILNACNAIVNPTEGIVEEVDEEEDLVESKFEKMGEQDDIHIAYAKLYKVSDKHEKLYRLATKKRSDMELDLEELMKLIRPLEYCGLRTTSWLKGPKSLKKSCSRLELDWKGLPVQSLMRCLAFRNLFLIDPVWGMISLLLILLLLVLLCLFHLLIMLSLRTMMLKLF